MNLSSPEQQCELSFQRAHSAAALRPQRYGGIVLCGGRSRRMGHDKIWLRFGAETMLQRVVRLLRQAVDELVVVAGADQHLPSFDDHVHVRVHRDRRPEVGPLEGIAVGLAALANAQSARKGPQPSNLDSAHHVCPQETGQPDNSAPIRLAFVVGCDMPLLRPELVRRMFELAADCDLVIPAIDGRYQPLAAVYAVDVLPQIEKLLCSGRRRPIELLPLVRAQVVAEEFLRAVDPQLLSFFNVNNPTEYDIALRCAGLVPGTSYVQEPPGKDA